MDWLKWVSAKPDGDGMRLWTEDVPFATTRSSPDPVPTREELGRWPPRWNASLVPLTPEEQARPYAKYYTMEFPGPDPRTWP